MSVERVFSKVQNINYRVTKIRKKDVTIYLCSMVDANLMVTTTQFIHETLTICNLITQTTTGNQIQVLLKKPNNSLITEKQQNQIRTSVPINVYCILVIAALYWDFLLLFIFLYYLKQTVKLFSNIANIYIY